MIHRLTVAEQAYTSTGAKLAAHQPIFDKLADTGYASIIRATMTLHQVCSARCSYCSTSRREKRDAITLAEAIKFIVQLYDHQALHNALHFTRYNDAYHELHGVPIRLRGLILSGGGQPNLWPPFAEFVTWLRTTTDIKLGLITNAFPKNVPESTYDAFAWVRVSVTPAEASNYPGGRFEDQYRPPIAGTLGLSYVVGPWTEDDDLKRLDDAAHAWGATYARTLVDCNLPRAAQLQAHEELGARLLRLGLTRDDGTPTGKIFHQLKYHGTPEEAEELWDEGQCFLQAYNTFWDTTGHEEHGKSWCFPCDSVTVLAEEESSVFAGEGTFASGGTPKMVQLGRPSARRFEPAWGTVTNDEVHRLFAEPLKPFFDPRKQCSACLFMKNNRAVKELRDGSARLENGGLGLAHDLQHVEFP